MAKRVTMEQFNELEGRVKGLVYMIDMVEKKRAKDFRYLHERITKLETKNGKKPI